MGNRVAPSKAADAQPVAADTNPNETHSVESHGHSCNKALMPGLADDVLVDVCLYVPRLELDAALTLSNGTRDRVERLSDRLPLHKLQDVYLRELNGELRLEYPEPNPLGRWVKIPIDASVDFTSFAYVRNAYVHRLLFEDGALGAFPNLFDALYSLKNARLLHTVVNELIVKAEPFTLVRSKPLPLSVQAGEVASPATWLAESVFAEVVRLLSKTLSPKRLACDLRFDISREHVTGLLGHPWVKAQRELDLSISYAFSARLDVHVDASSKKMAAALAKYLIEKFEGSAVQTLSVGVANVAIFANEYAKRFISAENPTAIPNVTFREHHQFNPMRAAQPREAVILDGVVFGQPLVQVQVLRKVNVIQDHGLIKNYPAEELQPTEVYLIRNAKVGLEATVSCTTYRTFMTHMPSAVLLCHFRVGNHVPDADAVEDYFVAEPWKVVERSH